MRGGCMPHGMWGIAVPHTAQMIRQEIVHLRVRAVVRADDPAVVERGALECVYGLSLIHI